MGMAFAMVAASDANIESALKYHRWYGASLLPTIRRRSRKLARTRASSLFWVSYSAALTPLPQRWKSWVQVERLAPAHI
jgi:hypothetical protein